MILSEVQLRELTGRARSDAQRRELEHLRIPFRMRRDGSIVVAEADVPLVREGATAKEAEPELQP